MTKTPKAKPTITQLSPELAEKFWVLAIGMLPIDEVAPNDYNPNSMSPEKFNALKENITAGGFRKPLEVRETEAGYIIVDWEHRRKAMKELWYTEIAVVVVKDSEIEGKINTIAANNIHGEPVSIKMAELIVALKEEYGHDYITKMTGMLEDEIVQYENMLQIPDDFDDVESLENVNKLPTSLIINMFPSELKTFDEAIEKAIDQIGETGPNIYYAVKDQIGVVDAMLKQSLEINKTKNWLKNKSLALELVATIFISLCKDNVLLVKQHVLELEAKRKAESDISGKDEIK